MGQEVMRLSNSQHQAEVRNHCANIHLELGRVESAPSDWSWLFGCLRCAR